MSEPNGGNLIGKLAYGLMFVALWPVLLAAWAHRLDQSVFVTWPVPLAAPVAAAALGSGIVLIGAAMRALWVHGGGLPMNAFPPRRLVEQSVYRLFTHPIYLGHALAVFGAAALAHSPAGFWIVAPVASLAAVALVLGHEARAAHALLGPRRNRAVLSLPPADEASSSLATKCAAIVLAWGAWALAYAVLSQLPTPSGARELRFAFEFEWPLSSAWLWPYSLAYPLAALCPLALRSNADVRCFIIGVWTASVSGFGAMLLWPAKAALVAGDAGTLATLNRAFDAEWLACPSFHVAWSLLAAHTYARRWPDLRLPAYAVSAVIAASCIGTGSHALIDVVMAIPLFVLAARHDAAAQAIIRIGERIANSWRAWRVGPFRVISHAPWTAAAAIVGALTAAMLAGPGHARPIALVVAAGLAGALLFGRLVEGRHLSRPFGYFGFLIGGVAMLAALTLLVGDAAIRVAAAVAAAAPLAQAIGRGRCLVQGCCHGGPHSGRFAIRVEHAMSRVACVAHLRGTPVRATQLFSAFANLMIAAVLLRLWTAEAPASLICGLYLVLTGLARFAEEGTRGEPQTPVMAQLTLYQWLSVVAFLAGIVVTMIPAMPVHAAMQIDVAAIWVALASGAISTLAMSIDWPDTKLPMSLLCPPSALQR